jgi:hypothetical protein
MREPEDTSVHSRVEPESDTTRYAAQHLPQDAARHLRAAADAVDDLRKSLARELSRRERGSAPRSGMTE